MRRGDIVIIADRGVGDYGGKPRPAVVVQSELFEETEKLHQDAIAHAKYRVSSDTSRTARR